MRYILFFIAALLALPAYAQQQNTPYVLKTTPSRCPLSNCTVTSGGTGQTVLNANAGRKMFCVGNLDTTEVLTFDMGQAATSGSLPVPPLTTTCMGGAAIWQGTVSVEAATTNHKFVVEEFQ